MLRMSGHLDRVFPFLQTLSLVELEKIVRVSLFDSVVSLVQILGTSMKTA